MCVDDSTALQLTARPSSGAAPLAVVFEGFGSVGGGRPVTLDFGDGQVDPSIAVVGSFKRSHIYTKRGSYQPRIIDSVLGTVFATTTQITVTDASAVTSTIVSAYVSAPRVGSGDTMSISWSATNPPADTGIVLDLYKANNADATSTKIGTIALSSLPAGSTTWTVPFGGGACTLQFPNGLCGVNLTGGFYFVRASLVSGNLFAQPPVVIASGDSSQFSVNQ